MVQGSNRRVIALLASGVLVGALGLLGQQVVDWVTVERSQPFGVGATSSAGERDLKPLERVFGANSPTMLTRVETARGAFTVEGYWALPNERAVFVQRRLSGRRWLCGADVKYCYPVISGGEGDLL